MDKDILNKLALDEWYKILIYLGFAGCLIALTNQIKITLISNNGLLSGSFGLILIGFGESIKWKHHVDNNYYHNNYAIVDNRKISLMIKKSNGLEEAIQLIGVILIIIPFLYKII